jgi:transcriptional repressor NrdR
MYCPVCRSKETKVIDSRITQDGMSIRRRRACGKCQYRFSTVEEMELLDVMVIKNNGRREAYSRDKLEAGIKQSLVKRPYTEDTFHRLIHKIERDIQKKPGKHWSAGTKSKEIKSKDIGDIIMKHLRRFDKVAYIRFASIYRAFQDLDKFQSEVSALTKKKKKK